jgi:hypothetical protein
VAECIQCRAYTKFTAGLCYDCYSDRNSKNALDTKNLEMVGLTEKDYQYRYNMIKGRIAETLIQELFLSLSYNVFRYGMENTIPGIMELLKGVRSDVAYNIRRMPDFVIQNPKTKDVFFVEVKFRASGEFKAKDLAKDYPYTNAYIILVSTRHIKCITVEELLAGQEITTTSRNYLGSRKEFDLDKETIISFCQFAVQFFAGVEIKSQA